jgi:hypothetical protein
MSDWSTPELMTHPAPPTATQGRPPRPSLRGPAMAGAAAAAAAMSVIALTALGAVSAVAILGPSTFVLLWCATLLAGAVGGAALALLGRRRGGG